MSINAKECFIKALCGVIFVLALIIINAQKVEAADYYYVVVSTPGGSVSDGAHTVWGCNKTQGFVTGLNSWYTGQYLYPYLPLVLHYTVPDDGCTWDIFGSGTYGYSSAYSAGTNYFTFTVTHTTTGTFTGYSPKTATDAANNAYSAANAAAASAATAATAANSAATNALNAYTDANYIRNTMLSTDGGIVQDANGTVLGEARQANTKLDVLQTTVTNIQNNLGGDTTPPVPVLKTVSGANATTGDSIRAVLDISDNVSSQFTYSLDEIVYNPVPGDKIITLPITQPGANVISVWVKDESGNIGTTSICIRKL